MTFEAGSQIRLGSSPLVAGWLLLMHGSALVPLWFSGMPPFLLGFLTSSVVMHAGWTLLRHAWLRHSKSAVGLAVDESHRCALFLRDGRMVQGDIAESTLVTGRLVILAIRTGRLRALSHLVLVPDRLDPEAFRALRVRLKWSRFQAAVPSHS